MEMLHQQHNFSHAHKPRCHQPVQLEQANEHHTPNNQIYCWDICFRSKLLSQMQLSIRVKDLKRSQFATWEPTSNQQRHSSTHSTQHVTHQDQRKALLKANCYDSLGLTLQKKNLKRMLDASNT